MRSRRFRRQTRAAFEGRSSGCSDILETPWHGRSGLMQFLICAPFSFLAQIVLQSLVHGLTTTRGRICNLLWLSIKRSRDSMVYDRHDLESSSRERHWKCGHGWYV